MNTERNRKSVVIDDEVLKSLRKEIKSYRFMIEAEESMGVDRRILKRLLKENRCAPDTLEKIQSYLNPQKVA